MRDYVPRLEKFGISAARMRELQWVCRQYDEDRRRASAIRRGEVDRPAHGGNTAWRRKDPTGDQAIRAADNRYARRVHAIEASAKAADHQLWRYIIKNACRRIPYEYLGAPCSKQYFDRIRRMFYVELDGRM